jgi:hypothetical protein
MTRKRDLPFDPKRACGVCRQRGAYDFGFEHVCGECADWAEHCEEDDDAGSE